MINNNTASGFQTPSQVYFQNYPTPYPQAFQMNQPVPALSVQYPSIRIDSINFNEIVRAIYPDVEGRCLNDTFCNLCSLGFNIGSEARLLPCGHCFHSKCIYDFMIIGNKKLCPTCNRLYL
jgi:Ring finger domain